MANFCIVALILPLLMAVSKELLASEIDMNLFERLCGDISINDTEFGSQSNTSELVCNEQPHRQQLNATMQEFKRTSNWTSLHLSLFSLLDNNSAAYRQLKTVGDGEPLVTSKISACGYTQLISLLLCAGLDVNRQSNLTGDHWLFGTSLTGSVNIVNLLVSQGADVDMRDRTGYTPLMVAAQCGYIDVLRALVAAGANTTVRHSLGQNALEEAQAMDNAAVVEYLQKLPH